MMMMKNPVILVACVLLFSSLAVMASQKAYDPDKCCFQFYPKHLPKNKVMSYKPTDTRCPKEGVIFTMKKGAAICADPSVAWVKDVIDTLQARIVNSPATTPSN